MPPLHIYLDSLASNLLTKTELDIGIVTQPYIDIAHCIRAGFCVSHALREWVRITIGFNYSEPFSLTLDPTTIRYMGTDERSILHIILRAQKTRRRKKAKIPYGVSIHDDPVREKLKEASNRETLLLMPNKKPTWKEKVAEFTQLAMYCPLFEEWDKNNVPSSPTAVYRGQIPRDIAILEVVHALDAL